MRSTVVCTALIAGAGCIFGANDKGVTDTGVQRDAESTSDASPVDATQDAGANGDVEVDSAMRSDVADAEMPDSADLTDSGTGDAPYEIVRRYEGSTQGSPVADVPSPVARFGSGFLTGYYDDSTGAAYIGWYDEDKPDRLDFTVHLSGSVAFDIAGTAEQGYAALVGPTEQIFLGLEEDPNNPGTLLESTDDFAANDTTFGALDIGFEQGVPFAGSMRTVNQTDILDLLQISDGWGRSEQREPYRAAAVETIGGTEQSPRMRVLVGAVTSRGYELTDFLLDTEASMSDPWTSTAASCGSAPPVAPRIFPLSRGWVLALAQTLDGPEWRLIECAQPRREAPVELPGAGSVAEFDVAEETLVFEQQAVAWIQEGQVHFGLLEIDRDVPSATIVDGWAVPDAASAIHVRTAANPDRGTFAIHLQRANEVELILLKRRQ